MFITGPGGGGGNGTSPLGFAYVEAPLAFGAVDSGGDGGKVPLDFDPVPNGVLGNQILAFGSVFALARAASNKASAAACEFVSSGLGGIDEHEQMSKLASSDEIAFEPDTLSTNGYFCRPSH